jgi:UDP-N-acetylglucosamine enolpyruvyl transferase
MHPFYHSPWANQPKQLQWGSPKGCSTAKVHKASTDNLLLDQVGLDKAAQVDQAAELPEVEVAEALAVAGAEVEVAEALAVAGAGVEGLAVVAAREVVQEEVDPGSNYFQLRVKILCNQFSLPPLIG